jgi:hypothetical protein
MKLIKGEGELCFERGTLKENSNPTVMLHRFLVLRHHYYHYHHHHHHEHYYHHEFF